MTAHGKAIVVLLVAGALFLTHSSEASITDFNTSMQADIHQIKASARQQEMLNFRSQMAAEAKRQAQQDVEQKQIDVARRRARDVFVSRSCYPRFMEEPVGLTQSHLSAGELESALEGTEMAGLGRAFYQAEQEYKVNAVLLVAIAALESGWGTSSYAHERNNLFGYAAYTNNPDAASYFPSQTQSIMAAAKVLSRDYLADGGRYHQNYDIGGGEIAWAGTLPAIGYKWAGDADWAEHVAATMMTIVERISRRVSR